MADTIPVAGAIVLEQSGELLAVEAAPDSHATRSYKDIARHVYRFVQEIQWSGSDHAVAVRILGDDLGQRAIAANVGLLLAPLADVAIAADPIVRSAFDVQGEDEIDSDADYVSPRDKVWLVPPEHLDGDEVARRFAITFGPVSGPGHPADLVLVVVPDSVPEVALPPADDLTEFAAVVMGSYSETPTEVRVDRGHG